MDAIVYMVLLGLGLTVVPQPCQPLLDAYGLKVNPLGRQAPSAISPHRHGLAPCGRRQPSHL
jgi:hypothetical protein